MTDRRYIAEPVPHGRRHQVRDTANPTAGPHRSGIVGFADTAADAQALADELEHPAARTPPPVTLLEGRRFPGRSRR